MEGVANSLLESMARGIPVIASEASELLLDEGKNGFLYADTEDFLAYFAENYAVQYNSMSVNARNYIASQHDPEHISAKHLRLFRQWQ